MGPIGSAGRIAALEKALRELAKHHEQCCVAGPYDPENDEPQCVEYLEAVRLVG